MERILYAGTTSANEQSCVASNAQAPLNRCRLSLGGAASGHYRPQSDEGTPDLVRSKLCPRGNRNNYADSSSATAMANSRAGQWERKELLRAIPCGRG